MIQTPAAFEALVRDAGRDAELLRLEPRLSNGNRGIYLREPNEVGADGEAHEYRVTVKPLFHPKASSNEKVAFRVRLLLESTEDWVQVGEQVTITSAGELLTVLVNPSDLEPGAHYAEVRGIDPDHPERGPLFRIPVTVLRPIRSLDHEADEELIEELKEDDEPLMVDGWLEEELHDMKPGRIERRFIPVPEGATWADIRFHLRAGEDGGRVRMFMVHAVQAIPGWTNRDGEKNNVVVLQPGVEKVISFPVHPGRTMELAIAQYWSSLGQCDLQYELTFHGLTPDQREVRLVPGEPAVRVEVVTPLQHERLSPSAKLTSYRRLVKPTSATIKQLAADRDGFDEVRRFHELELSYPIEQSESGSVTPQFLQTDDLLYDSEFGGTLLAIFEEGGRRVATDDIWPHGVSLEKGSYTLKLWIRHDDRSKLDALKTLPMALERSLGSPVSLSIYPTIVDAKEGGSKVSATWVAPGEKQQLYVGNVSKAPTGTLAGDVLIGTITYGEAGTHGGAGQAPGGFPLSVVVSPVDAPASASAKATESWTWLDQTETKDSDAKLKKSVRDAKLEFLKTLSLDKDAKLFDKLSKELLEENKQLLPVVVSRLHKLDDDAEKRKTQLDQVIEAADAVLAEIDQGRIALALIGRLVEGDKEAEKARKEAENLKELLIDTLYRRARAIGYKELPEVVAKQPIEDAEAYDKEFEAAYAALAKWVDPTDEKYFLLHLRRETRKEHFGESLKWLNKHGESSNFWHLEKRRKLYDALGWDHLTDNAWRQRSVRFPTRQP